MNHGTNSHRQTTTAGLYTESSC